MTVLYLRARMVGVAQLVELRLVMPAVVGSSPIVHPILFTRLSQPVDYKWSAAFPSSGSEACCKSNGASSKPIPRVLASPANVLVASLASSDPICLQRSPDNPSASMVSLWIGVRRVRKEDTCRTEIRSG